jgi:hypothetical protein
VPFAYGKLIDFFNGKVPAEHSLGFGSGVDAILTAGVLLILSCEFCILFTLVGALFNQFCPFQMVLRA